MRLSHIVFAIGCCAVSSAWAAQAPTRVAFDERFPPFTEASPDGPQGVAADLLREAAGRARLELVFIPLPFAAVQKALDDGSADAIFPLAINPQRKATLDFSAPLLMSGGAIFARAGEPVPGALQDWTGKTVVTPGTGPLAGYIEREAPGVRLVRTATYEESLQALVSGAADAAALNVQAGARLAEQLHPGKIVRADRMFLELPLAVAARKGAQAEFLQSLDVGLAATARDGTAQRIEDHWMRPADR